jgi:WD40 repeat protein
MNVSRTVRRFASAAAVLSWFAPAIGSAQQPTQQPVIARLVAEPARINMKAGETLPFKVTAYDAQGNVIPNPQVRTSGPRRALAFGEGTITARDAGTFTAVVASVAAPGAPSVTLEVPVTVTWPNLSRIEIVPQPGRLYTGVMLAHTVQGFHADNSPRKGVVANWKSSDPAVAAVDRFGNVTALKAGTVTITAEAEGVTATKRYTTAPNPVASVAMDVKENTIWTGDVIHLNATPKRANGAAVPDAPVTWSYTYTPDDTLFAAGGAGIIEDGLFAANQPGRFTIMAQVGGALARKVVEVKTRDVKRRISVEGRGLITNSHTSDLWPWTGKDGRDYVLVGTWGADGYGIVFDITDLKNPVKTDSVKVDARTINDVMISPDGRYGVLSREGASNRVNGVVILDLANPAHPKIASTFSQELTGGVHNVFATNDYLFAISGGQKYVIIDVRDIYNPKFVSEYRHPNARIHDLWVNDGIAYSAQGGVGTVVVDVGNGKYGGSIQNPKLITVFPINSGHEIFPYFQKKTGKVYLFIGDEEMSRTGRVWEGTNYRNSMTEAGGIAQTSGGYTHIVDFTDPLKPKNVARYHLEDYGSHDIIVEDDVLYQAYYDGGVRMVDVSGEMLGNLVDQKREIAVFKPYDPKGFTANAPFVMNAMPWKGHVLFTDFNSGLWVAKIQPKVAF